MNKLIAAVTLAVGLIQFAFIGYASAASLSTTFVGGNGQFGNMFDIENVSGSPIELTGMFEGNFDANVSGQSLEVWYRSGTYVGHETDRTGWTLLGSDTITSVGSNIPTPYDVGNTLALAAGQSLGVLVILESTGGGVMLYTNGATPDVFSDGVLQITTGIGLAHDTTGLGPNEPPINTSGFFPNRIWNGTIEYTTTQVVPYSASFAYLAMCIAGLWLSRRTVLA